MEASNCHCDMQANSFASSVGAKALTMVQVHAVALPAGFPAAPEKPAPSASQQPLIMLVRWCCAQAVIVAGIMEFLGAVLLGAGVTGAHPGPSLKRIGSS